MKIKEINIGGLTAKSNVFLAPMAGYTDFAFRGICSELGAGLTVTEMVSAKGIIYKSKGTTDLLHIDKKESLVAAQIFGNDAEIMRRAIESEELKNFKIIDINMGCPAPKIFNNGEGSALLTDLKNVEKIITECSKTDKIITVKTRIGLDKNHLISEEFARIAEGSGAQLVTLHGRTKADFFTGEINYSEIAKAKNAVKIPLIANGGIYSEEDAAKTMELTGADGIMLGQGALYSPLLFSKITATATNYDIKSIILEHIRQLKTVFEDRTVAVNFRKIMYNYLKYSGLNKGEKAKFNYAESTAEIETLINSLL